MRSVPNLASLAHFQCTLHPRATANATAASTPAITPRRDLHAATQPLDLGSGGNL